MEPMPATTDDGGLAAVRARRHPDCWACSPTSDGGLAVAFFAAPDGSVTGRFACDGKYVGYPGCLHGGVTSALLDAAMTNCLMARGKPGLTARLEVRYLLPVPLGVTVQVRGWWLGGRGSLQMLRADVRHEGVVLAEANGTFMTHTLDAPPASKGEDDEEARDHHL